MPRLPSSAERVVNRQRLGCYPVMGIEVTLRLQPDFHVRQLEGLGEFYCIVVTSKAGLPCVIRRVYRQQVCI